MWNYESEDEAIRDALRLARGMTYKSAIAGLNFGGGKSIIIGDSKTLKSEMLFRCFGRFIDGLNGRYITAEDVGTTVEDMEMVLMETPHVTGLSRNLGGSGDPAPVTAHGVYCGMLACIQHKLGKDSLKGLRVAVQGLGAVGMRLVKQLSKEGAILSVTDIDSNLCQKAEETYGATIVGPEEIYTTDAEIFAPCALGAILNDETIAKLKPPIVAGSANNQLANSSLHGEALRQRGILYAPDYVINSGGLINAVHEIEGYDQKRSFQLTELIADSLLKVFQRSDREEIPTNQASDEEAEERIRQVRLLKKIHKPRRRDTKALTKNRRHR